jgi:hypothetical protein
MGFEDAVAFKKPTRRFSSLHHLASYLFNSFNYRAARRSVIFQIISHQNYCMVIINRFHKHTKVIF